MFDTITMWQIVQISNDNDHYTDDDQPSIFTHFFLSHMNQRAFLHVIYQDKQSLDQLGKITKEERMMSHVC